MYSLRARAQVGHLLTRSFYQKLSCASERGFFSSLLLMPILWRTKARFGLSVWAREEGGGLPGGDEEDSVMASWLQVPISICTFV